MYDIIVERAAEKQLDDLPANYANAVAIAIACLAGWPSHGRDVKPMRGSYRHQWRLRVGDSRVIFEVDDQRNTITVLRFFHRGKGY